MSVIILLLIASLSVSLIFLGAFIWSIKDKQYDDEFSPPMRILFDDASEAAKKTNDEMLLFKTEQEFNYEKF
ncbi:MAG: cbb3-type cytochrome oxidase assembly protein CcoS [Bacteroidetes bacterium]|nr:cbb3-type cytochrome oxidase assembly protein CcoS [Bacteroidota bacterium]